MSLPIKSCRHHNLSLPVVDWKTKDTTLTENNIWGLNNQQQFSLFNTVIHIYNHINILRISFFGGVESPKSVIY